MADHEEEIEPKLSQKAWTLQTYTVALSKFWINLELVVILLRVIQFADPDFLYLNL